MFKFTDLQYIPINLASGAINVPVCSKTVWEQLCICKSADIACGMLVKDVPQNLPDKLVLVQTYKESILKAKEELQLEIPYYPRKDDKDDIKHTIYTYPDKMVSGYSGLSIYEVDNISILEYWLLLRDSFIYKLAQTKDGREYLNNAYRLTQTEADEDIEL